MSARLSARLSVRSHHPKAKLILVIGGASSGKSAVALELAGRAGKRAFVATGEPLDEEMAERIRAHQLSRQGRWDTYEVPVDLAKWFQTDARSYRTIVVDCLTLWLSNLRRQGVQPGRVRGLVRDLLQAARGVSGRVVMVSNELGLGIVPGDADTRRFRMLAGEVNQQVAEEADEVHLVVSGLALRLK
jgi:adenosylcobinamide kinase/adenosylcobinamide-phosphate guanylyltransferase